MQDFHPRLPWWIYTLTQARVHAFVMWGFGRHLRRLARDPGAAHRALTAFVGGQQAAGRRCILVVTGKGAWREGGGVLREAVPRWLNEPALRQKVLSFSYAQPKDGGEGALYILLRRLR